MISERRKTEIEAIFFRNGMIHLNEIEKDFKILMNDKWQDFELISGRWYAKEDYYVVKRKDVEEELKLTQKKLEELYFEKKVKFL